MARRVSAPLIGAGLALVAITIVSLQLLVDREHGWFVAAILVHAAVYLGGTWWVISGRARASDLLVILAIAVILRLIAFPAPRA